MFRIKICGVTNPQDALAAFDAGADGIGLNFYEHSRRHVDNTTARTITDELYKAAGVPGRSLVYAVGVFVNHAASDVKQIYDEARLAVAQLHGDEPPEFLADIAGIPTIRVRRLDERGVTALAEDLRACQAAMEVVPPSMKSSCDLLVDAAAPGQYGGTGETVSWSALADYQRWLGRMHLILAGGLTPDNVAEAIRIVRPHAVDVASGVESAPGKKDAAKMRDFVAAAHEAFAALVPRN
jgi:phosphoribosylanthranilate isomerase